jgi:hypothetical protein
MNQVHRPCLCERYCGDVDEPEDGPKPWPVCKGLRRAPKPPLVEVVLVHRDELNANA